MWEDAGRRRRRRRAAVAAFSCACARLAVWKASFKAPPPRACRARKCLLWHCSGTLPTLPVLAVCTMRLTACCSVETHAEMRRKGGRAKRRSQRRSCDDSTLN
eukprot:8212629-Pyramimonas_sp.AAC.1